MLVSAKSNKNIVILLFMIVFSILGKRLIKRIASDNYPAVYSGITIYATGLFITIAFIVSVLLIVANKY